MYFFNLATIFAQITNLKIETYFIFQALYGLKVSTALRKIKESYFGKMFLGFFENVTLFLEMIIWCLWLKRYRWYFFRWLSLSLYRKILWPLFMNKVHLPKGCRVTTRREFTFNHDVPRCSRYSFDQPRKD